MDYILFVDDREDFALAFTTEAKAHNIGIVHKRSFNGLKEVLPSLQHKFFAVILDIKCLITDDQEIEDSSFIGVAMSYLNQHLPFFPKFILTGDDKEFDKFRSFFNNEKVFLKTPQGVANLFIELGDCIINSDIIKIRRENFQVFDLFVKGFYDAGTEETLIKVLRNYDESNFNNFGGIFRDIRALQETIYKVINGKDVNVVPNNKFATNGMIMFNPLMKHLNGYPNSQHAPTTTVYQNGAIFNLTNSLYWTCGEYIHANPNRTYFISRYTLRALINSLMELFIWSEQYVK